MPSLQLQRTDVVVGVDTHKDEHVAVALDGIGGRLGSHAAPATPDGHAALLAWAHSHGRVVAFGVEGTGTYGLGLARYLRRHGARIHEVSRPPRPGARRLAGKSDLVDAEHAAREVLAGGATSVPKRADGAAETLRLIKVARDPAVKARTQATADAASANLLRAALVTSPDGLRAELRGLTPGRLVAACAGLPEAPPTDPASASAYALRSLAKRWLALDAEVREHTGHLRRILEEAAPELVAAYGVGPDSAAELMIAAGDNGERIRSEAAFAKLCGVCPIPASSGRTTGRHRLNRGGNRKANAALHRVVIVRLKWHEPTRAYMARRTAEGRTRKDVIRCLKRYVARELFRLLPRHVERAAEKVAVGA